MFIETYTRMNNGRFVVRLPFKQSPEKLGESKHIAINRMHYLKKRFAKEPQFQTLYNNFMK